MAYYSDAELQQLGFKHLGKNVKISTKASIYNADQIEIGDHSRIDDFCVISGKVTIGKHVHLAPFCLVAGGEKGIRIDDFAGMAYHAQIFSQSDDYSGRTLTNPTIPARYKAEKKASSALGRHVIVGAGSIIFPGVEIAEGCAVGAMTLVTHSTQPWGIYVGNPARRIKDRKQDLLQLEAQFLQDTAHDSL